MLNQIKDLTERYAFGVCRYIGEKMSISTARVRLYFIYISFITMGSPVIIYLFVAFWLNVKSYIKQSRDLIRGW